MVNHTCPAGDADLVLLPASSPLALVLLLPEDSASQFYELVTRSVWKVADLRP